MPITHQLKFEKVFSRKDQIISTPIVAAPEPEVKQKKKSTMAASFRNMMKKAIFKKDASALDEERKKKDE